MRHAHEGIPTPQQPVHHEAGVIMRIAQPDEVFDSTWRVVMRPNKPTAAVCHDGRVYRGVMHGRVWAQIDIPKDPAEEGFVAYNTVTDDECFVSRKQAEAISKNAGNINRPNGLTGRVDSEELQGGTLH